ncbi:MAG: dephospho-CoA kinase [Planctomycetota bacterium]
MTLVVGLTGGIGSGKSTVSGILKELGAEVFDADTIAHQVLEEPKIAGAVRQRLGTTDRKELGRIVFGDPESRRFLEGLIHPAVRERIEAGVHASKAPMAVLDVPLLTESPLRLLCQEVIFLKVPDDTRFQRVQSRGWMREHWASREAAQAPLDKKEAQATFVLDNSLPPEEVKARLKDWWNKVLRVS